MQQVPVGEVGWRTRTLLGHLSAFTIKPSSDNEEEPQHASYSLSKEQMITATLQKHEGVNLQLV